MKAKGLEISGTFSRQVGAISMDLLLTNKALQVMSDFAIQFNRNRYNACQAASAAHAASGDPCSLLSVGRDMPLAVCGMVGSKG